MAPRVRLSKDCRDGREEEPREPQDDLEGDQRRPPDRSPGKHGEDSIVEPPDPQWVEAVRHLRRRAESRVAPAASAAIARPAATSAVGRALDPPPSPRAPAGRPVALRALPPVLALQRGVLYGADVVIDRGGRQLTVRPLRIASDGVAPAFEVAVAGAEGTQIIRPQEVQIAFLVPATARLVARNHPCPCGSGGKFKRCCLDPSAVIADEQGPQAEA